MKLKHFLIGIVTFSSYFGAAITPAYAGRTFNMPNFDGRYIDLCATYYNNGHFGNPGTWHCHTGNTAQGIVTDAFCRQVGMSESVRWRYIEGSWENRKPVWKLSQEAIVRGAQLRDTPSSYNRWEPAEGGHYFTSIECK